MFCLSDESVWFNQNSPSDVTLVGRKPFSLAIVVAHVRLRAPPHQRLYFASTFDNIARKCIEKFRSNQGAEGIARHPVPTARTYLRTGSGEESRSLLGASSANAGCTTPGRLQAQTGGAGRWPLQTGKATNTPVCARSRASSLIKKNTKQPKREPDQGVEQRECGLQAVVQLQDTAESAQRRWLAGTRQLVAKDIRATASVRTVG